MRDWRINFNSGLEIGQIVTNEETNQIFGVDKQQRIKTDVYLKSFRIIRNLRI